MTMHTQADRQDPGGANRADIPVGLTALLADMFAVYLKTKNFHWHVSGPHFRDYHLLLDEQATQIVATTDTIADASGNSAPRPSSRSATSAGCSISRTTMPTRLRRATC